MDEIEPIAKIIATAREAMGWNQSELARAVDVTPQAVQKWEAGASVPRMRKMAEIAQALGIEHQKIVMAYGLQTAQERLEAKIKGRAKEREEDRVAAALSPDEKKLLRIFRAVPERFRETAIAQIKALADLSSEKVNPVTAEKNGTIDHRESAKPPPVRSSGESGVTTLDEAVSMFEGQSASRSTRSSERKSRQS